MRSSLNIAIAAAFPAAALAQAVPDEAPAVPAQAAASCVVPGQSRQDDGGEDKPSLAKDAGSAAANTGGAIAGGAVAGPIGAAVGGVLVDHLGRAVGKIFGGKKHDEDEEAAAAASCEPSGQPETLAARDDSGGE